MKKVLGIVACTFLLLTGCSTFNTGDEILQTDTEKEGEISIIPSHSFSNEEYKIILPYRTSVARDVITYQIDNRLDINEMEEGLRRHSTSVYDPKKYVYEEGQFLTANFTRSLIDELNPPIKEIVEKKKGTEEKVQAYRDNPRIFSHILEQNYLEKTDDNSVELVGISIGIAVKSAYRFQTEIGGPDYEEKIPPDVARAEGERIASIVFNNIREIEGLQNIPVMIAIYQEEEQSSLIPGNYIAKTFVGADEFAIGKWESLNEEYVLFPSEYADKEYTDDSQKIKKFASDVSDYFPNYVGFVGEGFYIGEDLQRLSVEIPLQFYGQGEVIGFTQYAYGLMMKTFSSDYDLEIIITSNDGPESVIFRAAGDSEASVHIFH